MEEVVKAKQAYQKRAAEERRKAEEVEGQIAQKRKVIADTKKKSEF